MNRLISTALALTTLALTVSVGSVAQPVRQNLGEGWTFRQARGFNSYPATVPGVVHTDLMAAGIIDDPFIGLNERGVQWVDKEDWVYSVMFDADEATLARDRVELVFEGLDTFADVKLNGEVILQTDNMFRRYVADVRSLLKASGNELEVYFHSPIKRTLPLWEATPWRDIIESGNDQSANGGLLGARVGVFARKAGYHFGWDWGPRLVTSGIWRPVYLESWDDVRIADVFYRQASVTAERAEVEVTVTLDWAADVAVAADLKDAENVEIRLRNLTDGGVLASRRGGAQKAVSLDFAIDDPRLWWTNGLGEAFLYEFEVEVLADGREIDSHRQKLGLRSVRLVTEPDGWGESFYIELNGVPVFMKGANYIPSDSFLPRVTAEKYEQTIHDAVLSNMNMLRVWGGGIYENDIFYDLCDEHGLLVWQDFMFGCALYPAEGELMENIKMEARENVRRLRNHTCIALWCGNNECLDMWFNWGVKRRFDAANPEWSAIQWRQFTDLYFNVLPSIVAEEHPGAAYRRSSPYTDETGVRSEDAGDYHDWDVWGGALELDRFKHKKSRFFSEYGFQGFPSFETVKRFAPLSKDWAVTSEIMLSHQRAGANGNQKIDFMMRRDYGEPVDFEAFTYLSQLMQADAMAMAMEAHRRQMPRCMGSLIWQMNDCWPVASWSGRDWYGNWKGQQYAIRRAFDDVLVSPVVEEGELRVYVVNDRAEAVRGEMVLRLVEGGEVATLNVEVPARSSVVVWRAAEWSPNEVMNVSLAEAGGRVYENNFYPAAHNAMHYRRPNIEVTMEGDLVTLRSDVFARGVCLVAENSSAAATPTNETGVSEVSADGVSGVGTAAGCGSDGGVACRVLFSDNFFDLLPGVPVTVRVIEGALTSPPKAMSYADAVK
ncbi:MAG: glycoside hydrolase family 2 protein [Alistipes sp.]|jgi:beta-mannosidase|nr:glycoside hydrolase family 2 protein [Alistipes sp.]